MNLIKIMNNIPWLSKDGVLKLYDVKSMDGIDPKKVTAVFAFIFNDRGEILLINNKKKDREFEVPGGHVEVDEELLYSLSRECVEEAFVDIKNPQIFAVNEINDPNATRYPKQSYQAFYIAEVATLNPFYENDEVKERKFFKEAEFLNLEWSKKYPELCQLALKAQKGQ